MIFCQGHFEGFLFLLKKNQQQQEEGEEEEGENRFVDDSFIIIVEKFQEETSGGNLVGGIGNAVMCSPPVVPLTSTPADSCILVDNNRV